MVTPAGNVFDVSIASLPSPEPAEDAVFPIYVEPAPSADCNTLKVVSSIIVIATKTPEVGVKLSVVSEKALPAYPKPAFPDSITVYLCNPAIVYSFRCA